jgi:hypothetical protein
VDEKLALERSWTYLQVLFVSLFDEASDYGDGAQF